MRERVEEAGGEMTIETTRGVTLTVRIPADPGRPTSRLPASREAAA
jgi:glucose-6-phosphate-specific signal transduction histidine kinase